jgi:hypothetical protein
MSKQGQEVVARLSQDAVPPVRNRAVLFEAGGRRGRRRTCLARHDPSCLRDDLLCGVRRPTASELTRSVRCAGRTRCCPEDAAHEARLK